MRYNKFAYHTLIAISVMLSSLICSPNHRRTDAEVRTSPPAMKGVCWVAGDSIATHNIQQITDVSVNWMSQTPFAYMEGHDTTEIRSNFDTAWWGENDRGIIQTAEMAREAGIKTMLKPHIWMHTSDGKWRSDIAMNSEEEWQQWFASYEEWIVHYAELAEKGSIEALCIGTELHQTIKRTEAWRSIISKIRKVYNGEITYAANWYQEYEDVQFWDDLDYIGIQAYFPLTDKHNPSKKKLMEGWEKHITAMEQLAERYNKKIIFTEIGYKNTSDTAHEPWVWPRSLDSTVVRSDKAQIICYEALFESFWNKPWFNGLFIWKWFHTTYKHDNYDDYFAEWDRRREEYAARRNRKDRPLIYFSPQRTGAIDVMSEWYHKE